MTETTFLGLPLVEAAQAQKHVTVNEALARIDALAQITLASRSVTVPPAVVADGMVYGVPNGAVNDWAGQGGTIAVAINGGWVFVSPQKGWRAYIADESTLAAYDGGAWRAGAITIAAHGAGAALRVLEFDHAVAAGPLSVTAETIPSHAMVMAVTGRVTEALTGTLTSWDLGANGVAGQFATGIGLPFGSWLKGVLSTPLSYYAATPLSLTANGGDFAGGTVRLAVHYIDFALPGL